MKVVLFFINIFITYPTFANREVFIGEVMDLHPKIVEQKPFSLTGPAGSYQKIFEVKNGEKGRHCLYFKVPLNSSSNGELYRVTSQRPCRLSSLKVKEQIKEKVLGIKSLRFYDIDLERKMSFEISFEVKGEEFKKTYFIPFISETRSYWSGLFPLTITPNKSTSFVNFKEGDVCHQGCGELKNQCHKCPDGQWTITLSLKCANKVSAVCGSSLCGGRGQNACVKMTGLKQNFSCEEIKDFAYCSYGRELECQSEGQVTCR